MRHAWFLVLRPKAEDTEGMDQQGRAFRLFAQPKACATQSNSFDQAAQAVLQPEIGFALSTP
jgi:hypothetical protein